MLVRCVHDDPQRISWVRGEESKIWRLGVEAKRDGHGCVCFALIARRVFKPNGETEVTGRGREYTREFVYPIAVPHSA